MEKRKRGRPKEVGMDMYSVTLSLGDRTYKAYGTTAHEALLSLKPEKISSKAVFTLEYNGKTAAFSKNVFMTRRILTNNMSALVFGRNLMMRLK